METSVSNFAYQVAEDWVERAVYDNYDFIMRKIGKKVRRALVNMDPFLFDKGKEIIGSVFDTIWCEVSVALHKEYAKRFNKQLQEQKKMERALEGRLELWPAFPSFDWQRPHVWLRCRLLYAWQPADTTVFGQLRDPTVWPWMLVFLSPSPVISVVAWLVLLVCISMEYDEYQLTNFTVLYRGAAFISIGVIWSTLGFIAVYSCTLSADEGDCHTSAPGVSPQGVRAMAFCMLRMLFGSVAWMQLIQLRCQTARAERAKTADPKQRALIKLPSRLAMAASRGSTLGLALGVLLAIGVVSRGLYLYSNGDIAATDAEGGVFGECFTASIAIAWVLQNVGTFVGGWLAVTVSFYGSLRALRTRLMRQLPRALAQLKTALYDRWLLARHHDRARFEALDEGGAGGAYAQSQRELLLSSGAEATEEDVQAAMRVQRFARGLLARLEVRRVRNDPHAPATSDKLSGLMLWEATSMMFMISATLSHLYRYIGPQPLWTAAERYSELGVFSRFPAYVFFCLSDGLLLHWQVAFATYCLIAVGSLVAYGPFLVVRVPLIGKKLLNMPQQTAFDRVGRIRSIMSRRDAYDKWRRERSMMEEELKRIKADVKAYAKQHNTELTA